MQRLKKKLRSTVGFYSRLLEEVLMNHPVRLAINGYGRCVLRALQESPLREQYRVVPVNEPADLESMVYLTRFDSTHFDISALVITNYYQGWRIMNLLQKKENFQHGYYAELAADATSI